MASCIELARSVLLHGLCLMVPLAGGCAADEGALPAGTSTSPAARSPASAELSSPAPDSADGGARWRPVRVRFSAWIGSRPFACGESYSAEGVTVTPVDLRFFVQDLALVTLGGEEQRVELEVRPPWQLESVGLIDFEDGSGACAVGTAALNAELTGRVPPGEYSGVAFTNGVPEALNHADPAALPPPLQAGGMSWGWLLGYRFFMAELATRAGGDAAAPGAGLLHLGSGACSGSPGAAGVNCAKPNRNRVRLEGFDPDSDLVAIDVAELFVGLGAGELETCHSSGEECGPFFERVGVDLDRGTPRPGQTLYRVLPEALASRGLP